MAKQGHSDDAQTTNTTVDRIPSVDEQDALDAVDTAENAVRAAADALADAGRDDLAAELGISVASDIDDVRARADEDDVDTEESARVLLAHIGELKRMRDGIGAVDRLNRKTGRGVKMTGVLGDIRTEIHSEQLDAYHALGDLLENEGESQ